MTQAEAIRAHLESGLDLTPITALDLYGVFRLAARVDELRDEGMDIETIIEKRGRKRYARYKLRGPVQRSLFAPSMPTVRNGAAPASDLAGASL
jgi:hypothetical protein